MADMQYADMVVLALIALSMLVGLWRGFIKEAFALAVWVAAFLVAFQYSGLVAEMITDQVSLPSARTAIAFGALFLLVLVVGALITFLVGKLVEKTGLTGTDRLLGSVFGVLRGLLIVLALIMVAGFTPVPKDPWWQSSVAIQSLLPLAEWLAELLPASVHDYLDLYATGVDDTVIEA